MGSLMSPLSGSTVARAWKVLSLSSPRFPYLFVDDGAPLEHAVSMLTECVDADISRIGQHLLGR